MLYHCIQGGKEHNFLYRNTDTNRPALVGSKLHKELSMYRNFITYRHL